MTNQEILIKAIEKAVAGGWVDGDAAMSQLSVTPEWALGSQIPFVMSIIFNHDFAKALWGDELQFPFAHWMRYRKIDHQDNRIPAWQHHLQQMVIADDPIEYLGENV